MLDRPALPGDTTFHDLRHAFASTALAEGVPISEVSRWLGHKSIKNHCRPVRPPGS
jgi:integrase